MSPDRHRGDGAGCHARGMRELEALAIVLILFVCLAIVHVAIERYDVKSRERRGR